MPFPPSFDHVWDLTQPPDTQLASLGAQDFRNLKDDVMQRLSLLTGTLANRPTPETVNATWGGAGFGLTYEATDTGQAFQWNGAAWIEITYSRRFFDFSIVSVTGGTAGPGNLITIPGNSLQAGSFLDITALAINSAGPGGFSTGIILQQGAGTQYFFGSEVIDPNGTSMFGYVMFPDATHFRADGFGANSSTVVGVSLLAAATIDLTQPTKIYTQCNVSPNTTTVQFQGLSVIAYR